VPFSDYLKKFRKNDYSAKPDDDAKKGTGDKGEDSPDEMSREIKLTDDEMQAFKDSQPGSDLACEVHGTIESDGKFRVMSVSPLGGGESYGDENGMAQQVAKRVTPTVQISPS